MTGLISYRSSIFFCPTLELYKGNALPSSAFVFVQDKQLLVIGLNIFIQKALSFQLTDGTQKTISNRQSKTDFATDD